MELYKGDRQGGEDDEDAGEDDYGRGAPGSAGQDWLGSSARPAGAAPTHSSASPPQCAANVGSSIAPRELSKLYDDCIRVVCGSTNHHYSRKGTERGLTFEDCCGTRLFEAKTNIKVIGRFEELGKKDIDLFEYLDYSYMQMLINVEFNQQFKQLIEDQNSTLLESNMNFIEMSNQIL